MSQVTLATVRTHLFSIPTSNECTPSLDPLDPFAFPALEPTPILRGPGDCHLTTAT